MQPGNTRWLLRGSAAFAALFGALTVKSGGSALFGEGAAGGNYAAFVIWFNFLAGFAYVAAAIGLWLRQRWSACLALGLAAMTIVVFGVFGVYVATGGAYEARTVWAMTARSVIWIGIALLAWRALGMVRRKTGGPLPEANGEAIRRE